jgi:hypothetical protein
MTPPFAVSKDEAFQLVGMPKLVQRWMHHGWIKIVRPGGRGRRTMIDYKSLEAAYEKYRRGVEPPRLPSEVAAVPKGRASRRPATSPVAASSAFQTKQSGVAHTERHRQP